MVNVTLFELHLEGAQFTANAPSSGEAGEAEEREVDVEDDEATGGFPRGLLAALGVIAAVASLLVVRKVLGGPGTEDESE